MKKIWKKLVKFHWEAFMWNGAYFLIALIPVGIYALIRYSWYKANGKNYWGQTPEEVKEMMDEEIRNNPFTNHFINW